MRNWLNSSVPVPDGAGPSQPKVIPENAATQAERARCLQIIAAYTDALDRGELRSLTKRRLLVHIYRRVWGMRPVKAWVRELNDTQTHPERLRCMAVIAEFGRRVEAGEFDHVSRRDLLAELSEHVVRG